MLRSDTPGHVVVLHFYPAAFRAHVKVADEAGQSVAAVVPDLDSPGVAVGLVAREHPQGCRDGGHGGVEVGAAVGFGLGP